MLTISAVHSEESEKKEKDGSYVCRERHYGSYSRSFDVSTIRQEEIKAAYKNGVLELTRPKRRLRPRPQPAPSRSSEQLCRALEKALPPRRHGARKGMCPAARRAACRLKRDRGPAAARPLTAFEIPAHGGGFPFMGLLLSATGRQGG